MPLQAGGDVMIKEFAFTKIIVADLARMEAFYRQGLGFELVTRLSIDKSGWRLEESILARRGGDGCQLILVQYFDRPCPVAGEAVIGLYVRNIEALVASALAAGGSLPVPVRELPEQNLKLCYVHDPEGHAIELLEMLG